MPRVAGEGEIARVSGEQRWESGGAQGLGQAEELLGMRCPGGDRCQPSAPGTVRQEVGTGCSLALS